MTTHTEGRKPLTVAQLYSAAHPKINGALCHKAIDCDVTACHCLVIGTVRCGVNQMANLPLTTEQIEARVEDARFLNEPNLWACVCGRLEMDGYTVTNELAGQIGAVLYP